MGAPSDGRFITAPVPAEMREGVELTPGVEVAKPTAEMIDDLDGVPTQLTRIRLPRPDHIPAGAPKVDHLYPPIPDSVFPSRAQRGLSYDFPLFPDVQVRVQFSGNATADHLEQLTELLNVQCKKLREQEYRRATERAATARIPAPRKVNPKKAPPEKHDGD